MLSVLLKQSTRNLTMFRISSVIKYEIHQKKYFSTETQQNKMMSYYPDVINKMKDIINSCNTLDEGKYFERMLHYNLDGGRNTRGLMVVKTFEEMAPESIVNEENLKLANYLGWSMEMISRVLLILDDIMDGSTLRQGKLCWYKHEDVQLMAINDAFMLKAAVYVFLKHNFGDMPCYVHLLEALNKTMIYTTLGESMDLMLANQNVLTFTMDQYKSTAVNKTSYYSTCIPIEFGMILAGRERELQQPYAGKVLQEMGFFLQTYNDFLDCYGDPKDTGKDGTDIADGKCTWFSVTFLNLANDAQKAKIKEFYGKKDNEAVKKVKELYEEVRLREAYEKFKDETYNSIRSRIDQTKGIPVNLCRELMDDSYKRKD